ncbi:hypothetical protein BsWGS_08771 [Bradybaena similaris]
MAVVQVASPTANHVPTFSHNEWPPLNETPQELIHRRNVNCDDASSNCSQAVLSIQTYISRKLVSQIYSESLRADDTQVDGDDDVTSTNSSVCAVNRGKAFDEHSHSVAILNDLANESLVLEQVNTLQEDPSATSNYPVDVSVLHNAGAIEMNSCVTTHNIEVIAETTNSKKKKRLKKVRRKSTKKWKPCRNAELKFHISLPYFVDETTNFEDDSADEDSCEGEATQAESVEVSNSEANSNSSVQDEVSNSEANSNSSVQDDINFFLELGIDVVNYNNHDDLQDWDGVYFPMPAENTSCLVLDNKQSSHPKNKLAKISTSAKDPKFSTSQKAPPKPDGVSQPETLRAFPAPQFECSKIKKSDKYKLFELECSSNKRIYIRRDRHRKKEKAHKAVKSKNCRNVLNNMGRKRMYMHHRLIKMHSLNLDFRGSVKSYRIPAMPKATIAVDVAKEVFRADRKSPSHPHKDHHSLPPVQSLNHALHDTTNCATGIEGDLANFLISLQHRDLTPEDYDMLLRLDDTVKPKTLSENVLDKLRTEQIGPNGPEQGAGDWEPLCTICMEPYITGQVRKFLPCGHDFHTECIDKWLKNSSLNCPLDGLPVAAS